jgi:hypothetical protein
MTPGAVGPPGVRSVERVCGHYLLEKPPMQLGLRGGFSCLSLSLVPHYPIATLRQRGRVATYRARRTTAAGQGHGHTSWVVRAFSPKCPWHSGRQYIRKRHPPLSRGFCVGPCLSSAPHLRAAIFADFPPTRRGVEFRRTAPQPHAFNPGWRGAFLFKPYIPRIGCLMPFAASAPNP